MGTKDQVINQLHETQPRWFAVGTRSKCEKIVQQTLAKKGVHAYVPLVKSVKKYLRKIRHVEKPLIGCYVFVRITKEEYVRVLETENITGFVRFSKNLIAIPEEEITVLKKIVMESDIELEILAGTVYPGDPVIIAAGPLTGLQGKVVKVEGKRKFQVELERLGYSLLITIDAQFVQKTGGVF